MRVHSGLQNYVSSSEENEFSKNVVGGNEKHTKKEIVLVLMIRTTYSE